MQVQPELRINGCPLRHVMVIFVKHGTPARLKINLTEARFGPSSAAVVDGFRHWRF